MSPASLAKSPKIIAALLFLLIAGAACFYNYLSNRSLESESLSLKNQVENKKQLRKIHNKISTFESGHPGRDLPPLQGEALPKAQLADLPGRIESLAAKHQWRTLSIKPDMDALALKAETMAIETAFSGPVDRFDAFSESLLGEAYVERINGIGIRPEEETHLIDLIFTIRIK